jgi:2-methylcitrate dehydratase PrpD
MNAAVQAETQNTIAETVGAYAANFRYEDIPAHVLEQARYIMLDGIGIAFASTNFDFAQRAFSALSAQEDGASGSVIGIAGKLPMRDAVMMNGMLMHGLDFDDTFFAGGIHPTSSCLSSALGVAENLNASGTDLLTAYVLGMETVTRLAGVAQGALNQGGLHPSSMLGGFAGTIIAGWLMDLNAEQITMAQGITIGTAAGTLESLVDGSWTKRIQPGWAAAGGITAARLARQGFIGSRAAYEGKFGLYPAHMGARVSECDFSIATRGLGSTWNIPQVALKPFPACHATQAVIQAAITISQETGVQAEDIESILAIIPPHYVKLVCEPIERKHSLHRSLQPDQRPFRPAADCRRRAARHAHARTGAKGQLPGRHQFHGGAVQDQPAGRTGRQNQGWTHAVAQGCQADGFARPAHDAR